MTSNEILKADVLDILFQNRNKLYGAYRLRRDYNGNLARALGLTLAAALLLFSFRKPGGGKQQSPVGVDDSFEVRPISVVEVPPPPPPVQAPAPPPAVAERRLVDNFRIVAEPDPDLLPPEVHDLDQFLISNRNMDGPPATDMVAPPAPAAPTMPEPEVAPPPAPAPLQRAASFPGGIGAWTDFLRRHLAAPAELAPGERRTVLVRFTVAADGRVSGFRVEQSGGALFDREVIRVLQKMPRWSPAIRNDEPVTVSFTQPVTFVGELDH